jgi:Flp pilus assembly protein TadG
MSQQNPQRKSFLKALLRDPTANTIVISAAALIPLMAMVGGGVDASRYYTAAARLQAACDAGALAARRAMTTSSFTTAHQTIAFNFFDQNFPTGLYDTTNRTRTFTANSSGVVTGTASAVLPATIMTAFGYSSFNLSATCSADINIANTDIVFVLDVTGSMGGGAGGGISRIQALRNAVMLFYDTVASSTSSAARVRYGAVPYSMSVNLGGVIPSQHLASSHTYQSRRYVNQIIADETDVLIPRDLNRYPNPSAAQLRYNNNSNGTIPASERDLCQITNQGTFYIGGIRYDISGNTYKLNQISGGDSLRRAGCRANVRRIEEYRYEPRTFDVSAFKTGASVVTNTGVNGANVSHSWNGCIEEADTVNQATFNPVPAGAFDLDINLVPTTEAQRWKPALPEAIWSRPDPNAVFAGESYTRPSRSCATPSFRLRTIARGELLTYVNSLNPNGNTYHDIGMIWGARLISPNGLFAADNTNAPNGDPISRHIVFMSDGQLEPSLGIYGMYGVERMDRRITTDGNGTAQQQRHEQRFQAACRAAKNENMTVWVVAFGTTLSQSLRDCASPGRAYEASDSAQLNAAFMEIAQKIAALRLTQ